MLERLTRLHEHGVLSNEEFATDAARFEAFNRARSASSATSSRGFAPWGFAIGDVGQDVYLFYVYFQSPTNAALRSGHAPVGEEE